MSAPPAGPVPADERIVALDVVRGLAVLGILVMNVVEFGLPMRAYGDPSVAGGAHGADLATWLVQEALFDGRMRALFSMLFGCGIVLVGDRLRARGDAADILLKRCLWLIPLGIVHRFLLQWTGDILYVYGLIGALAVAFRMLSWRAQIVLGLTALCAFVPIEWRRHAASAEQREQALEAARLEAAAEPVPPDLAEARRRWERRIAAPAADANDAELAAIRGSWTDVARFRWDHNHAFQHSFVYHYFVWDVLGMMLLGMGLFRLGFFTGRLPPIAYAVTIAIGAAAALASFLLANAWAAAGFSRASIELQLWRGALYPFLRGATGLAWAALLILLTKRGAPFVTVPLAAVGRLAFSNYVLQTLLCTTLFFGWGFGCYGTLSRAQLMAVVAAAAAIQIALSMLWLRSFRFGPLEWLWRSLTWWKLQPLRRGTRESRGFAA